MCDSSQFYTQFSKRDDMPRIRPSVEDYLEMICRLSQTQDVVRVGQVAHSLHVRPSSASKMVQQLRDDGFVTSAPYGYISLTDKGTERGKYLLYRHDVVERFLCALNNSDDELEQAERIEHYLDRRTVAGLDRLTDEIIARRQSSSPLPSP